jgi:hypothetical protein
MRHVVPRLGHEIKSKLIPELGRLQKDRSLTLVSDYQSRRTIDGKGSARSLDRRLML